MGFLYDLEEAYEAKSAKPSKKTLRDGMLKTLPAYPPT